MKNVAKLDLYYGPCELEGPIGRFVEHDNYRRLRESLQNMTPADVYSTRDGRGDLGPPRADQAGDAGSAEASESVGRVMTTTRREP